MEVTEAEDEGRQSVLIGRPGLGRQPRGCPAIREMQNDKPRTAVSPRTRGWTFRRPRTTAVSPSSSAGRACAAKPAAAQPSGKCRTISQERRFASGAGDGRSDGQGQRPSDSPIGKLGLRRQIPASPAIRGAATRQPKARRFALSRGGWLSAPPVHWCPGCRRLARPLDGPRRLRRSRRIRALDADGGGSPEVQGLCKCRGRAACLPALGTSGEAGTDQRRPGRAELAQAAGRGGRSTIGISGEAGTDQRRPGRAEPAQVAGRGGRPGCPRDDGGRAGTYQRRSAASSMSFAATQRAPSRVRSRFQKGARDLR